MTQFILEGDYFTVVDIRKNDVNVIETYYTDNLPNGIENNKLYKWMNESVYEKHLNLDTDTFTKSNLFPWGVPTSNNIFKLSLNIHDSIVTNLENKIV